MGNPESSVDQLGSFSGRKSLLLFHYIGWCMLYRKLYQCSLEPTSVLRLTHSIQTISTSLLALTHTLKPACRPTDFRRQIIHTSSLSQVFLNFCHYWMWVNIMMTHFHVIPNTTESYRAGFATYMAPKQIII